MKQKKLCNALTQLLGLGIVGIQAAHAGGVVLVDTIADQPQAGFTTLREAIELANTTNGVFIEFDPDLFSSPQTITLENGELLISSNLTIGGPGKDLLTVVNDNDSLIFRIDDETDGIKNIEINEITMTNVTSQDESRSGGCISVFESLTLNDSILTGCNSNSNGGAVLVRFGSLTLNNTQILDNYSPRKGGGLYVREADVLVNQSTISGNSTQRDGGAIYVQRSSAIEIVNSTISNNTLLTPTNDRGGGIFINNNNSSLDMKNTTLINNTGEGIFISSESQVIIYNSIIANNIGGDCDFNQISASSDNQNNLDTDGSCDVNATNHITVEDPMLGPLADNGGFTLTHLPLPGSPVIDSGDDILCLQFDQIGTNRPQEGDGDGKAECDIGAVELSDFIFKNGFENLSES